MTEHWQPYADGTSGQQGDTSAAAEPSRRKVIDLAYDEVRYSTVHGLTWRELAEKWNVHHGVASGALSNLDRSGRIVRLRDQRNRCGVYVVNDPATIAGREVVPHRSNRRRSTQPTREQVTGVVEAWMASPGEYERHLIDRLMVLIAGTPTTKE